MKSSILAALATVLLTGSAFAADLVVYDPVPVVSSAAYDWTGFYVGVNAGYGGGTFEHPLTLDGVPDTETVVPLADGSLDVTAGGFLGGVQAGGNWQMDNNLLIGIEGDIQGSSIDGRVSLSITDVGGAILPDPGDTIEADAGTSLDWLATLRPRLGFVQDRFVVYATGGLAFGQTTSSVSFGIEGGEPFEASTTQDRFGWTLGAGIEYALTDNITFKTEYLYTDLGTEEVVSGTIGTTGDADLVGSLDSTVAFHTVRAGLNFRF